MIPTTAAYLTLIVDAPDEARARGIAADFLALTGCVVSPLIWTFYPKLGPHSRLGGVILLAGPDPIAAADALLALAVGPEGLAGGHRRHSVLDDGSFEYNRIFDTRIEPFRDPRLLWLDLEFSTYPEAQANLKQDCGWAD